MKKELFAGILLLLIFAASIANIVYLKHITEELVGYIDKAVENSDKDDWKASEESVTKAISRWNELHGYTHIVIKHDKIDATTDAFYDLLIEIYSENKNSTKATGEKIKAMLNNTYEMEKIRIGSIF